MALSDVDVVDLINAQVAADAKSQWDRLSFLQKRLRGDLTKVWMPSGADAEYKDLLTKARTPWLEYGAECISQALIVDGHSDTALWELAWEASGMSGRQSKLNYEIAAYGYGFLLSLPADDGGVLMRPLSTLGTFPVFEDPWDTEPQYVLHRMKKGANGKRGDDVHRFFDAEAMYTVYGDLSRPENVETAPHGLGINPVTIIPSEHVDQGFPDSLVERGTRAYQRVVDATFTLQMVQRYGAFPQKWQAGGVMATDEDGNALVRPSVDSILHTEEYEAKFGNFASADIDKVVAGVNDAVQQLAAVLQIPPHYLLGKVVNLSSDALAAAETNFIRRLRLLQETIGNGYESAFRVADLALGGAGDDTSAEVHWTDVSVRALGSTADAMLKIDAMTGRAGPDVSSLLFQMVPGWSKKDARQAANALAAAAPSESTDPGGASPSVADAVGAVKSQADALGVLIRSGVEPEEAATRVGMAGVDFTGATPTSLRLPVEDAAKLEEA